MVNYNNTRDFTGRKQKIKETAAKIIRIITVPPVIAAAVIISLFAGGRIGLREAVTVIAAVVLFPLLPYLFFRERDRQRRSGFIFSGIGYTAAVILAFAMKFSPAAKFFVVTYLLSVIILVATHKYLGIRSSAHACGTVGPLVITAYFFGPAAIIPVVLIAAASVVSSLVLERHTLAELMVGGMSSLCAAAICFAIFRF
jgi:hypothetical protein